jgi:hypothetical protein
MLHICRDLQIAYDRADRGQNQGFPYPLRESTREHVRVRYLARYLGIGYCGFTEMKVKRGHLCNLATCLRTGHKDTSKIASKITNPRAPENAVVFLKGNHRRVI